MSCRYNLLFEKIKKYVILLKFLIKLIPTVSLSIKVPPQILSAAIGSLNPYKGTYNSFVYLNRI